MYVLTIIYYSLVKLNIILIHNYDTISMCILLDNSFPPDDAADFGSFGSLAVIKKIINLLAE